MNHKTQFTKSEANMIRQLLREKSAASSEKQKGIRGKLRKLGFYLDDYRPIDGFDQLVGCGRVTIVDEPEPILVVAERVGGNDDEAHVLDLCDQVLGQRSSREHTFEFLRGDPGRRAKGHPLPVDAYYSDLKLVIEYRERQHTEKVPFFDKPDRMTVSGVNRGEQREIYDQRRRDILPKHGIQLLELHYTDFRHGSNKRLLRDRDADLQVVRRKLSGAGFPVR